MGSETIYLDNSATTPVKESIAGVVYKTLTEEFGNPSSLHGYGISAEKKVEEVRTLCKKLMDIKNGNVIFTSGGSEANNLAIFGGARRYQKEGNHLIATQVEHPSVLNPFIRLEEEGYEVTYLSVDDEGVLDIDSFKAALREDTILISIQHVNNEIGSIQPVEEIGDLLKKEGHSVLFHCDAVQGLMKLPVKPETWRVDLLSFSGHKFHAPKGVGGLYIREGIELLPLIYGGGQEKGFRAGTENVPGILGMGKAIDIIYYYYKSERDLMYEKKKKLCENILNKYKGAFLVGPPVEKGAPHILTLGFKGFKGEVILHALEEKGVFVSTGAACASRKKDKSSVLEAVNLDDEIKEGVLRFSLSYFNTMEEIETAADKVVEAVSELEGFLGR